jgi:tryptophanyl-tRNA synthetase
MRPTGKLHLGHLVGALDNWAKLQDEYECFFMVADWHALMSEYEDTSVIAEATRDNAIDWLAAGLDPEKSVIFVQSHVPEHVELYLVLCCITPIGWLERCPTYKEQKQEIKNRDLNNYAFLGYPVLQAADIVLYKATAVPVGEDQLPHLEITREIVRRFTSLYGREVFPEPQALLTKSSKLLGLDRRKMSKSYGNAILLSEEPDEIERKVMSMVTDPQRIHRTDPGRPDYCNVHRYYEAFAPDMAAQVADDCTDARIGCQDCKRRLGKIIIEFLAAFREKRKRLMEDAQKVDTILKDGAEKARTVASATLREVHEVLGF